MSAAYAYLIVMYSYSSSLASRAEQKERLQEARDNPESLRLVVDLHWAESASGKELSSLVKQLCYVYGRARASLTPPRLTLTSYQGRAAAALKRYVHGAGGQEGLDRLGVTSLKPLAVDHASLRRQPGLLRHVFTPLQGNMTDPCRTAIGYHMYNGAHPPPLVLGVYL